jgi:hypothetical protein
VTGTPAPVTSPTAQAPAPPLPTPAAAVLAAGPPPADPAAAPERAQPIREPEPPPVVREEPPPAPEPPARPAPEPAPEPVIAEEHRYVCRQGMEIDVDPEEAEISVNGRSIGTAERWDGEYVFEAPGRYLVRFAYPGYRSATVEVVVTPTVRRKWAEVEVELEEIE